MNDTPSPPPKFNPSAFSLSTMFLVVTLIGVGLGIAQSYPLIGWPFIVIATPVFVRTSKIIRFRQSLGESVVLIDKIKVFLRTLAVVTTLVAVGCVSVVTCLFGFCGTTMRMPGAGGGEITLTFLLMIVGALGVWASVRLNSRYEAKYRREIGVVEPGESASDSQTGNIEQVETEVTER